MIQGFGLGLRPEHYRELAAGEPRVQWLEALTENYLVPGGKPLAHLDRLRGDYPIVLHGVSLSIGSADVLDLGYLDALKDLARRLQPAWISDHLCWTGVDGRQLHDLLPLPLTLATLEHVATRIGRVQDYLGRELVLENASTYLRMEGAEMTEWDFLAMLSRRSGCGLLVDVNNIYVNSRNHGFDPRAYIAGLPAQAVRQIHLAGHSESAGMLIDTHDAPVCDAVWDLYEHAIARWGVVPAMIERDDRIPALPVLCDELDIARMRMARAIAKATGHALAA